MLGTNDRLQAPWVGCGPDEYDETEEDRYLAFCEHERDLQAETGEWDKQEGQLSEEMV